jgi:hypothetical protein
LEKANSLEDVADIQVIREQVDEAQDTLRQAEQLVPVEYHLIPNQGFAPLEEPMEEFWAVMGKLQVQWARITLAPIAGLTTLSDTQEEDLLRGITHYAQALAYFLQFSPELRLHKETFEGVYSYLKICGIPRLQKVRNRIEEVQREYKVSLVPLLKEIDETLALKPQFASEPDPYGING